MCTFVPDTGPSSVFCPNMETMFLWFFFFTTTPPPVSLKHCDMERGTSGVLFLFEAVLNG